MFIHGGYWQMLSKENSAYCVDPLVAKGIKVAVMNFQLCPVVSLAGQADQAYRSTKAILNYAVQIGARSAYNSMLLFLISNEYTANSLLHILNIFQTRHHCRSFVGCSFAHHCHASPEWRAAPAHTFSVRDLRYRWRVRFERIVHNEIGKRKQFASVEREICTRSITDVLQFIEMGSSSADFDSRWWIWFAPLYSTIDGVSPTRQRLLQGYRWFWIDRQLRSFWYC